MCVTLDCWIYIYNKNTFGLLISCTQHRTWMRQRHDMLYRQRGVGAIRFERINVSFGVRVLYNEGKLSFMVEDGMMKFRE